METKEESKIVVPPVILPADHCEKDQYKISIKEDEPGNTRLRVNLPAQGMALFEIVENEHFKPLLVVVLRADSEITALGILEKCKIMIMQFQTKLDKKIDLTTGVKGMIRGLIGGKRG